MRVIHLRSRYEKVIGVMDRSIDLKYETHLTTVSTPSLRIRNSCSVVLFRCNLVINIPPQWKTTKNSHNRVVVLALKSISLNRTSKGYEAVVYEFWKTQDRCSREIDRKDTMEVLLYERIIWRADCASFSFIQLLK